MSKEKVPAVLAKCFKEMTKHLNKGETGKFKEMKEDDMIGTIHFGFGTFVRNHYGLWGPKTGKKGTKVWQYFKDLGLFHADDMSAIFLTVWHRSLNDKPLKIDEQVKYYQAYWKKTEGAIKGR
jgi:hypothetical protein